MEDVEGTKTGFIHMKIVVENAFNKSLPRDQQNLKILSVGPHLNIVDLVRDTTKDGHMLWKPDGVRNMFLEVAIEVPTISRQRSDARKDVH